MVYRRAKAVGALAAVCQNYNIVSLELNEKYGFNFQTIEDVPAVQSIYKLHRQSSNPKLTDAINEVIGRTE